MMAHLSQPAVMAILVGILLAACGVLVAVCYLVGRLLRRSRGGLAVGCGLALLMLGMAVYGYTAGFRRLEVVHVEFASKDLPQAFDGYRIVQFSDAHVGTYAQGREDILRRAVDSINAQQADLVVFTGDLQNRVPDELGQFAPMLGRIKAKDGVCSVLGNHDYPMYVDTQNPGLLLRNAEMTKKVERDMGWTLLLNDRRRIWRDSASIVIAGMENDGEGRFPQLGDINTTLRGIGMDEFVVMLEHDPTSWRRKILPHCHAQLTLSGHTHGGQLSLLGLSPARLMYREWQGMYRAGDRALYVSKGLGGVIPFRLGATGEIVVITLRKL